MSCLFLIADKTEFVSEEIFIKDELLGQSSEDDKVGCLVIFNGQLGIMYTKQHYYVQT